MRKLLLLLVVLGSFVSLASNLNAGILLQPGFDQIFLEDVGGRTRAWAVGVADFNEDNIADVVSGDTWGDIHLLLGKGDGTFNDKGVVINRFFHDAYALAVGDFNNDGNADFAACRSGGSATPADDGQIQLYLGNGDGTFQSTGFPQQGIPIGDAGTDALVLAAADIDNDGDLDLVAGDRIAPDNGRADVTLFRNLFVESMTLSWNPETVISAVLLAPVDPEQPPYFPPASYLQAYGLAFGDVDNDGDPDLLLSDRASYLYVYENDGSGAFSPVRYGNIPTRPFAFARLHETFASQMPLVASDLNGDGFVDIAAGGTDAQWEGQVDLWLNIGPDAMGRPIFTGAGIIGGSGTDARGLAAGQLNPSEDSYMDLVFGNYEGDLYGLFADLTDSDGDGIVDRFDNAPFNANTPRIDMNTDGGVNYLDQLDNDFDGIGDPADEDDDDDGILDEEDNCAFTANPSQEDADGDGRGDACDALYDADFDGDGVPEWPLDPELRERAKQAKIKWSAADTHFIIRIDALGRVFQNEFTQTLADGAILSSEEWEDKKFDNYNDIGDAPANDGYNVPTDLSGGMNVPITLFTIPKQIWNAFGDPDPVSWLNDRLTDSELEIGLHGTYHANNTPNGDWATEPDRNFYSCETCGLTLEENYQLLRIGQRTLLGEYDDLWIQQSGADPDNSPKIDWHAAANPLISYAPPFNASDPASRDATALLGFLGFSASIFEEESSIFTPEGSHHEQFDQFGLYHASADLQVDPAEEDVLFGDSLMQEQEFGAFQKGATYNWPHEESELPKGLRKDKGPEHPTPWEDAPGIIKRQPNETGPFIPVMPQIVNSDGDYTTYLESITEFGGLNTWLIEEVEWSSRYCDDLPRLVFCHEAPGDINRENNMVHPGRWANWLALLQYVKDNGMAWTQGEYTLAMSYDNAPTVSNPDQADSDHDGIGDIIDGAVLKAAKHPILECHDESLLSARLTNSGVPISGQEVTFHYDADGDGNEELYIGTTDEDGMANVAVFSTRPLGLGFFYATWNGIVAAAEDSGKVTVVSTSAGPPLCPVPGKSRIIPAEMPKKN